MYKITKVWKNTLKHNKAKEGESIEVKVRRIMDNKEPIRDGAQILYTDRKEGVRPGTDIRTDRFEIALDAMDKVSKAHLAKREGKHNKPETTTDTNNGKETKTGPDGKTESAQATDNK